MTEEKPTRKRILYSDPWAATFIAMKRDEEIKIDRFEVTQEQETLACRGDSTVIVIESDGEYGSFSRRDSYVRADTLPRWFLKQLREALGINPYSNRIPLQLVPEMMLEDADIIIHLIWDGGHRQLVRTQITYWKEISRRLLDGTTTGNEPYVSKDSKGIKTDPALYADIVAEAKKRDESRDSGTGGDSSTGELST